MKQIKLVLGTIVVLTVASLVYIGTAQPFKKDSVLNAAEQADLDQHLGGIKEKLLFDYELSNGAEPVYQGDAFPRLNLPQLAGPTVNWNNPSVVTLGNAQIGSAAGLYESIKDVSIQKIHVISTGSYTEKDLSLFPSDVAILTSLVEDQSTEIISQILYENLGVYVQTSGYLVDSDGTILYARINHGGFTGLGAAVNQFVEGGTQAVTPSKETTMVAGTALTTDGLDLPTDVKEALDAELAKDMTVVMFSYEDACFVCGSWLSDADEFIESWREQGYGVVIVEADTNSDAFAMKTVDNGALVVSDKTSGESGELFEQWGVNVYPAFYIVEDGSFQGQVAYSETESNGKTYRNAPFEVVQEIAQSSVSAQAALE